MCFFISIIVPVLYHGSHFVNEFLLAKARKVGSYSCKSKSDTSESQKNDGYG